jgi:hypothetical protein
VSGKSIIRPFTGPDCSRAGFDGIFERKKVDGSLESSCVIICLLLLTMNVTKVSQYAPFGEIGDGAGIE